MKKIIRILITIILLFTSFSITSAYKYNQINNYLEKYYTKLDNKISDTQKKIDKLESIKYKIEKFYEREGDKLSRKNKQLLVFIKLSLVNKIRFYKKDLEEVDLTNLFGDIEEEKNNLEVINSNSYKMSYRGGGITQLFKTKGEGTKNIKYIELNFKYKCYSKISSIVENIYIEDENQTKQYNLYLKGTSKKGNICSTKYYAKNLKIDLGKRYFLNMGPFNSIIFKGRNTELNIYISDLVGDFKFENIPYIKYHIYDDQVDEFIFGGGFDKNISSIYNNINKIGKIYIITNKKDYKVHYINLRFNLKKDGEKISDESLLGQVYIVDNFGKKYIMEREKYGDVNKYITPGPVYTINMDLLGNTFDNINYNIKSFDIYADLYKLKKYKNNEVKIETLLDYTSIGIDGYNYNKQKRDTIFSTFVIGKIVIHLKGKKCYYGGTYTNDGEKVGYQKAFTYENGKKYYFINYKCENGNLYELNREFQYLSCNSGYIKKNGKCEKKNQEKPKIVSLKMELNKYYLVNINGVKTIISLDSFSTSGYLNGDIAPIMEIYSEYEDNKFFNILGTFVLPKGKGTNTSSDGFRTNINRIGFDYRLDSWDSKKYMTLSIRPKGYFNIKIKEIDKNNYELNLRKDLKTDKIIEIYRLLDKKMDLLK